MKGLAMTKLKLANPGPGRGSSSYPAGYTGS
ncbi:rCG29292 [Rattus norvegicus]|uniref:RCG29292 n=1 Tax=Rattus norvegicus TaxID=10116 RepID=A6K843_RAT|nr:rCG29292 [Rattus norvegicus]